MATSDEADAYQIYLLRLWRVRCHDRWQWRAFIESPHTGERHNFANPEELCAFLSQRCEGQRPATRPGKGR